MSECCRISCQVALRILNSFPRPVSTPKQVYSFVELLSIYHDAILSKHLPISKLNRYSLQMLKNSTYHRLATVFTISKHCQVLLEMIALKFDYHDDAILAIESFKTLIRLLLFRASGFRMQIYPVFPVRDFDLSQLSPNLGDNSDLWKGKRSGKVHCKIQAVTGHGGNTSSAVSKFLAVRALSEPNLNPSDMVPPLSGLERLSEYLHILRPFIYCFLI
jgi:hypothetical protein